MQDPFFEWSSLSNQLHFENVILDLLFSFLISNWITYHFRVPNSSCFIPTPQIYFLILIHWLPSRVRTLISWFGKRLSLICRTVFIHRILLDILIGNNMEITLWKKKKKYWANFFNSLIFYSFSWNLFPALLELG